MSHRASPGGGVSAHGQLSGNSAGDCHPVSAITGLQTALNGKAANDHDHAGTYATVGHGHAYNTLSGIPSTFAPIIGSGATQACAGNDSRLSDARTPTAHTQASTTISDSTSVGRAVLTAADQAAARTAIGAGTSSFSGAYGSLTGIPSTFAPIIGAGGTQACAGNDARLSDARTPTTHSITSAHSFPGGTSTFLRADGTFATPPGGSAVIASVRTTADRTTTSVTLGNVTDLAVPIGASEVWSFDAYILGGCNNTGGSQFAITVPSGATLRVQFTGNTNAATAFTTGVVTTSGGASVTFFTVNSGGRTVEAHGVVVNSTNAGNIQVQFKSVTAGQTTTVNANSFITGRRH